MHRFASSIRTQFTNPNHFGGRIILPFLACYVNTYFVKTYSVKRGIWIALYILSANVSTRPTLITHLHSKDILLMQTMQNIQTVAQKAEIRTFRFLPNIFLI